MGKTHDICRSVILYTDQSNDPSDCTFFALYRVMREVKLFVYPGFWVISQYFNFVCHFRTQTDEVMDNCVIMAVKFHVNIENILESFSVDRT